MSALGFDVPFTAVALSATVPKTVAGILAPANQAVEVKEILVTFADTDSTHGPVLVEYGPCTFATNAPGTNSTAFTPTKRDPGRPETVNTSCGHTWTTEPTVITVLSPEKIPAYNGVYHLIVSWDNPIVVPGGSGFVVRCTAPNATNATGKIGCKE